MTGTIKAYLAGAAAIVAVTAAVAMPQQARLGGMRGQLAGRAPVTSTPLPAGTTVERDIAYGADQAQRLDVYRPANAAGAPMLIMVHGGGWITGDKANPGVIDAKAAHWLPKGYILVSVNYRLVPQAKPMAQANDVANAIAFVQAHARSWGGDPARVVLMGHSAGAHLVTLLTADPSLAKSAGVKPWLGTIALDNAAYNVVELMQGQHLDLYDQAFGSDQQLWRAASPTLVIKSAPVPMLLVCSSKRADSCPQADAFAAKVKTLNGRATVVPVDMTHADINHLVGADSNYTATIDKFLNSIGLN